MAKNSDSGNTATCLAVAAATLIGSCAVGFGNVEPGHTNAQQAIGVICMFGAIPFAIAAFVITALTMAKSEENEKAEIAREGAERLRRAAEQAREDAICDFAVLDRAFAESRPFAEPVSENYLGTVTRILSGQDIGNDEFEKRDYARVKQSKIAGLNKKLFLCEVQGFVAAEDYDFEKQRFPLKVSFSKFEVFRGNSYLKEFTGFFPMDEEPAREWKRTVARGWRAVPIIVRSSKEEHVRHTLIGINLTG